MLGKVLVGGGAIEVDDVHERLPCILAGIVLGILQFKGVPHGGVDACLFIFHEGVGDKSVFALV